MPAPADERGPQGGDSGQLVQSIKQVGPGRSTEAPISVCLQLTDGSSATYALSATAAEELYHYLGIVFREGP